MGHHSILLTTHTYHILDKYNHNITWASQKNLTFTTAGTKVFVGSDKRKYVDTIAMGGRIVMDLDNTAGGQLALATSSVIYKKWKC